MASLLSNPFAPLSDDYEKQLKSQKTLQERKAKADSKTATQKAAARAKRIPPRLPVEIIPENAYDMDDPPIYRYMTPYSKRTWDPNVTKPVFLRWRSPPTVTTNPTEVTNPLYIEMIKTGWDGYHVSEHFLGDSDPFGKDWENPVWTFNRFGRTRTVLPYDVLTTFGVFPKDTRIFIAGEHEDYYDPDYCVYNDVAVVMPNGRIKVFAYPSGEFPPTDGHTATLVPGKKIYLIGSIGYVESRGNKAQVYVLDLPTMRIRRVITKGPDPGWIAGHEATLVSDDEIEVDVKAIEDAQTGSNAEGGGEKNRIRARKWRFRISRKEWAKVEDKS